MADSNVLDMIANPKIADPLGAITRGLQARGLANANALFQAHQAAGEAFQNSLNPDGTPNQPQLNMNLRAAGPTAALAAQESSQAGQTLDQTTFATHMARLTSLGNAAMGLVAQNPTGVPQAAVNSEIDTQAAKLGLSPTDVAQAKAQFGADPAANLKTILRNHAANLSAQQTLLGALTPTGDVDTGSGVVGIQRPAALSGQPQGAITPVGDPVTKNLSPGEKVQTQPVMLPSGQQGNQPVGSKYDASGNLISAPPSPSNPPRLPGAGGPQGFNPTSLPLGTGEAIAADVGKYKEDQFGIPVAQQRVQSLQKAQIALEAANTGRGSQGVHNMLATMQTLGIPTAGLADNVSSYDTAYKYLTDYARQSGAAAHSDLQLQTSEGANASTGISNQAALDVVHTNIGRERQAIARNMEAPNTGVGYGEHSSKFSTATDPRGFAIDAYKPADLNPDDPKSMVGRMTKTERDKFYKSVGIAMRLKLINPGAPAQ